MYWKPMAEGPSAAPGEDRDKRRADRRARRTGPPEGAVRRAAVADAPEIARLLHDFNTEFSVPTPGIAVLTDTARRLLAGGELTILLAGEGPDGLAQLQLLPSIWTGKLDAYLQELYVAPSKRGQGLGRDLLEEAMRIAREAGATRIELGTSEDDTTAIALYESRGFSNREDSPGGPRMLFYERDL
ncbi:MAG: GNAT family N-acetyltransferase [Solirubrobacterales bacterium]|nr:GNAT family N-acetyltransferase [Solirubrobacterales bacterium]